MKKRVLYAACFGVISAFGLVWPAAAQVQHVMQIAGEDGLTSRTVAWLDDRAGTCPARVPRPWWGRAERDRPHDRSTGPG